MLLDMREIYSEEYFDSIDKALLFIENELYEKNCTIENKPIVNCIGHTHIDIEWQWTRDQTREKIQRSFATAKTLMEQYPEYKFMLSQPELYRYLKEETPEKYEELKELIKNNRWEPEGAMYLEADCNLISGESFIRQIMQGKKFFSEEFGKESRVLFLPDVFGYSAALPQILKKCGIDYFVTSKISWNDTNTLPVDAFIWVGIDGTEIFTNFITTQNYKAIDKERYTTYVGHLSPTMIKGTWDRFHQKKFTNRTLHTFGFGDGGGGPTKDMLETYQRLKKGLPGMPVVKMDFLGEHLDKEFEEFKQNCCRFKQTPKWVGELYLEFHRGTYTSIGKNKRNNRKAEFALQNCESLSYIDFLFDGTYDADGIYKNWNKILHNQFHDIIPGSSIKEVYELSDKDYEETANYCDSIINEKMKKLSDNISSQGGILIYNPLGFARHGRVNVNGCNFETKTIPPFGYTVVEDPAIECRVKIDDFTAENDFYVLKLDKSGRIISLLDKRVDREVFKSGEFGNELQVFEDFPFDYDAWEISDYYKQKMWVLDDNAEIETIFDGSRAGFKIVKKYLKSIISQNIWLYSNCARIDFETDVDWHERHQLLKVAFTLDIHTTTANYEIQFGHVERPTHSNTSWDSAKFEVYGHKWADLSDNGYGVALLNDCKYGYSTEGSTIKLSLLKSATFPNTEADQGKHLFTYSLLPHIGDFRNAGVIHEAYSLNQPLIYKSVSKHSGNLPKQFSLISTDKENVIIETVKKSENGNGMIVRMYEAFDKRSNVKICVAQKFTKAYLCDLLENVISELPFDGKTVNLSVENFEIVTLKFE